MKKIDGKVDIMNMKINTICFILLFFCLIGAVSATDSMNETLENTIQPQDSVYQASPDENDRLEANIEKSDALETSITESKKSATYMHTISVYVKQKVSIKAPNVKMRYKDGSKFTVTLKDPNKKAINKAKVKITINGKTYIKKTDSKGKASINLNFKSGTYTVTTSFDETALYKKQSVKSKVTIKSTIKCSDLNKYYRNTAAYHSTFYDKKGKLLKETSVKFKLKGKTYSVKTNKKGAAKLNINLKPGKYSISSINPKTSESVAKTITIKSLIESKDMTMKEGDGSKFSVKILNSNGKASPNKKVTLKANGNTYTIKTDKNGIASIPIDFEAGKYAITTEYDGLKNTNYITIAKVIKHTQFSHETLIPNYVNVTHPYVFYNSGYVLKSGTNGIIKLPKNELFTIQISETKAYQFSTSVISGVDTIVIGEKTHLIPFDSSEIKSNYIKSNLKGDGILITRLSNYTQIEFRSTTEENTEMFGLYMDKGPNYSETIVYVQNYRVKAAVNVYTVNYDELGLRYNLGKYYGKSMYDLNYQSYDEFTNYHTDLIRFANTGEPVTLSYFGNSIAGYPSKEDIVTRFIVNGKDELLKEETISYGLGEKYRSTIGFEVMQSYAILNERVTKNVLEYWESLKEGYLSKFGIMNVYGMYMASIETAWLADEIANKYAKEFGVTWKRGHTATILGGINMDDTYLNILNADMGMDVKGNSKNVELFRLINSLYLPNIEDYVLEPAANRYENHTLNSLDNILYSIANGNFSITQMGDMMYLFSGNDSAIVLNVTSGVGSVIISSGNSVYKGSRITTKDDCCSVCCLADDIINGIKGNLNKFKGGLSGITDKMNKLHPLSLLIYQALKKVLPTTLGGASSVGLGLFTTMAMIQSAGVTYRTGMVDEKDWHPVMDTYTFTRSGYLQGKKVYNIPRQDGRYDYVEVPINPDFTLDRDNAKYISPQQTKQLTRQETYQYFDDDYWSPFSMPTKYWDESWRKP